MCVRVLVSDCDFVNEILSKSSICKNVPHCLCVCTRLVGRGGDVVQAVPGSVLPQTEEKMLSCYF